MSILSLHHITIVCQSAQRAADFYTRVLGLRLVKRTVNFDAPTTYHLYFGNEGAEPGTLVTYFERKPEREKPVRMGCGQTHHFALAVADEDSQLEWRERLISSGLSVTPVMDRVYFKSIYLHDPDGHIVELATLGPGFDVDESADTLGADLQLPPWLSASHERIVSALKPITVDPWASTTADVAG